MIWLEEVFIFILKNIQCWKMEWEEGRPESIWTAGSSICGILKAKNEKTHLIQAIIVNSTTK